MQQEGDGIGVEVFLEWCEASVRVCVCVCVVVSERERIETFGRKLKLNFKGKTKFVYLTQIVINIRLDCE